MNRTVPELIEYLESTLEKISSEKEQLEPFLIRKFLPLYPEGQIIDGFEFVINYFIPEVIKQTKLFYKDQIHLRRKDGSNADIQQDIKKAKLAIGELKILEGYKEWYIGDEIEKVIFEKEYLANLVGLYLKVFSHLYDQEELEINYPPIKNGEFAENLRYIQQKIQLKVLKIMDT